MSQQALRVLAVGDCNTWGIHERPLGNTILDKFCRQLEQLGYQTTKQNLGFGMGTTREGVQLMVLDAQPADILLINFGLVDTWITSIPQYYVLYYPDGFVRKRLRKLLKFVKRRLRSPLLRRFVAVGPVVSADEYADNVRTMIALARDKSPHVKILLWGSPPVQFDPDRNINLQKYNGVLASVAEETQSIYVDTTDIVVQLPASKAYIDLVHLNEAATDAIAKQLVEACERRQLAAAG